MSSILELQSRIEKLESLIYGVNNIENLAPIVRRTLESVSRATNIMISDITKKSRKRELVEARQMCYSILKSNTRMSLVDIGLIFGGKDHTSIIHGLQTHNDLLKTDKKYKESYNKSLYNFINYERLQQEQEPIINAS